MLQTKEGPSFDPYTGFALNCAAERLVALGWRNYGENQYPSMLPFDTLLEATGSNNK